MSKAVKHLIHLFAVLVLASLSFITYAHDQAQTFVVSFGSVCCGPDLEALERFRLFLPEFEREHQLKLNYRTSSWGEEGEFDYCFNLGGFDQNLVTALANGIRTTVGYSQLVLIGENVKCHGQQTHAQTARAPSTLVVSFGSICCGTDSEAESRIDDFLGKFKHEHSVKLNYQKIYWGKEGEFDYCIELGGLDRKLVDPLMQGLRTAIEKSTLVDLVEDGKCHAGR